MDFAVITITIITTFLYNPQQIICNVMNAYNRVCMHNSKLFTFFFIYNTLFSFVQTLLESTLITRLDQSSEFCDYMIINMLFTKNLTMIFCVRQKCK